MIWLRASAHFNFLICPLLAVPKFTPPTCLYVSERLCGWCAHRPRACASDPSTTQTQCPSRRRAHGDDFSRVLTPHWALCTIHQLSICPNAQSTKENEKWAMMLLFDVWVCCWRSRGRNNSIWLRCRLNDCWLTAEVDGWTAGAQIAQCNQLMQRERSNLFSNVALNYSQ